jgi:probable F420-dependent oxidoreductase
MPTPFRFAVQTSSASSGPEWRALARQVEDLGYSTLFIPDHFGDQWGPLVAMTIAAETTSRLNVGTLVFDNDYRHPVVLAKEIATLDLASEGRVEFGLGAGWMVSDYDESGIPLERPGVRIDRMVESLRVMKALWSDGKADLDGRHYTIRNAQGTPRPASTPRPKIIIGGGGQRVLSIAAREADIVGVNPSLASGAIGAAVAQSAKAERFRERVDWVRAAAGDRFDDLELQLNTFMVNITDDRRGVAEMLAGGFGLTTDEALEVPLAFVGSVDDICDQLRERREVYGFSYIVVHQGEIEPFAEVVARLAGT